MAGADVISTAFRHAQWLDVRRSLVAGNIANANTPDYRAKDLAPFDVALSEAASGPSSGADRFAQTDASHAADVVDAEGQASHSGNTVDLDAELLKAGSISGAQSLDSAVIRAFSRMLLSASKG